MYMIPIYYLFFFMVQITTLKCISTNTSIFRTGNRELNDELPIIIFHHITTEEPCLGESIFTYGLI